MGVEWVKEENNQITYRLIPEKIDMSIKKPLEDLKSMNRETNGFSKDKTKRLIGVVPYEFMYNYAIHHGVQPRQVDEYYTADNGEKMKMLLKEFESFRMVDEL